MSDLTDRQDLDPGVLLASLDALGIAAAVTTADGTIVQLGRTWRDVLAPDEATGSIAWDRLVPASHLDALHAWLAPHDATSAPLECPLLHASGTTRWHQLHRQRVSSGATHLWICHATDIGALKRREALLHDKASLQAQMLDVSVDCIKLITPDGCLIHLNKAGRLALGVSAQESLGKRWSSLLPEEVREDAEAARADAAAGRTSRFPGRSVSDAMGEQFWDNLLTPVQDDDGVTRSILCVSREVTAERRAVQTLRENEERLAMAAKVGGLGIWDYDIASDRLHCDASWYRIMGRDPGDAIRSIEDFRPLIHPEDVDRATDVGRTASDLLAGDLDYSITFRIVRPNGDIRWVRSLAYLEEKEGQAVRAVGFVADITDAWRGELALRDANRALEEEKTSLARKVLEDPLTGISNRRHLDSELARIRVHAHETGQPLCVGLIDVDRFKQFNDHYGHLAGDAALKRIATALQGVTRRTDLVARYGGEEFAFVLAGAPDPGAIMDKFLDAVAGLAIPHEDSPTGLLSISGGVVVSLSASESPKHLIQASDEALYEAKQAGRNRFVVRVLPGP